MNEIPLSTILTGLGIAAVILFVIIVITRYAAAIGRFLLIAGLLVVAAVVGSALLSQGAANFKQAQVTDHAVKSVQTMATGQTVAIVAGACAFGGLAATAAIGVALFAVLHYRHKLQTTNGTKTQGQRQTTALQQYPTYTPPNYYAPQQPTVDITRINPKDWGW